MSTHPIEESLLEGRDALAEALATAATGARRQLRLLSFDLDTRLYGGEALHEAVKRFLLGSDRARLRVLLNQPRLASARGHRLVELGRTLSSRVEFRELPEDQLAGQRADWLIVDEHTLVERREPEALHAVLHRHAAARIRTRANDFDALWDQSSPAAELRVLGL